MKIHVFTDGSSRGNPGPGGWASVIIAEAFSPDSEGGPEEAMVVELGGAENPTTNNQMELRAAIEGIRAASARFDADSSRPASFCVYSDSSYVIKGITVWIGGWRRNGWRTSAKKTVENRELWEELADTAEGKEIRWRYVGGHVGILGNERCDHIATAYADGREIGLYDGPLKAYDLPRILDISWDEGKRAQKSSASSRARARAHSYVSAISGVIEVHHSWAECEKRVKGVAGAKYKKSLNAQDEAAIIAEFQAL